MGHDELSVEDGVAFRLVGSFCVLVNGRVVTDADMGSRKARLLLKLLVVERGASVPTDRVADLLWRDRPPRQPVRNVATLVSRLRAVLGSDVIRGNPAGYRLAEAVAQATDLDDAARLLREAESQLAGAAPRLALAGAQRALAVLGTGAVLEDEPYADWAEPARRQAAALMRRARQLAGSAALAVGDARAARRLAEEAIEADALDEEAYRMLMRAAQALSESGHALRVYERLRAQLASELGADPARATRELHQAILQDRPARSAVPAIDAAAGPHDSGLVGRERETAQLRGLWTAAVGGRAAVVLVTGDAGIGKTRLATSIAQLAEATGGVVLQARCYLSERSLFLQPLVDALRPHLGTLPPAVLHEVTDGWSAVLSAFLPEIPAPPVGGSAQPGTVAAEGRRLFDALIALLRRLSQHAPLLLLLDDLHNAGLGTAEFLHYLARNDASARLLCLGTVRDEEGRTVLDQLGDVAERINVGPLSNAAVTRLAVAAGRGDLAQDIQDRTRGHTLFVVETLRGLSTSQPGVPASLQAAVLARVRQVGPDGEEVLRAAAVLGPPFEPVTLAAILAVPPAVAARQCERALRLRLLVVAGRAYEFANDLIQEVLYATTPEPTRVAHHRAAAEQLLDHPEAMARHAAAAGDWRRAGRAWLLAGEHAMRRFAASDAVVLLTRALDADERADDPELRGRAHLVRGRARESLADYEAAWADHREAMSLAHGASDRRLEMLALRELGGDVPVALGRETDECMTYLERGLGLAEVLGARAHQAGLLARMAILSADRLRFDQGVEYGSRAVAVARMTGEDDALADALDGLKTAYAYLGESTDLERVLADLLPLLRRRGDLWRLQWAVFEAAIPALARADWDRAVQCIDEAIAINSETGYGTYAAWFLAHRGWIERLRGRLDDAVRHGRAAVDIASRARHPWWTAAANAFLATTLLERGAVAEAVSLLEEGVSAASRGGADQYRLRCLGALAEATGSAEIITDAAALLQRVRTPVGGAWLLGADAYLGVARAWLARDEPSRALAAIAPVLAAAERTTWVPVLAEACLLAGRCHLRTGDVARARARLTRARDLAARHGLQRIEGVAVEVMAPL